MEAAIKPAIKPLAYASTPVHHYIQRIIPFLEQRQYYATTVKDEKERMELVHHVNEQILRALGIIP